jgi:hypothetical protein
LCDEYTRTIEAARALAAETFNLERLPSAERGMRSAECPAEIGPASSRQRNIAM